jgi:quinol monooxygenase YgiN
MMQFLIQYTVKPALVEEQEAAINTFIAAIKGVGDPDASYTSLKAEDGVSFTHIARFRTEEALKRFQSQPHFEEFSKGLPPRCTDGPNATKLSLVATTDS